MLWKVLHFLVGKSWWLTILGIRLFHDAQTHFAECSGTCKRRWNTWSTRMLRRIGRKNPLEKMEPPQIGMMMKETFYGKTTVIEVFKSAVNGSFLAKHVREARNKSRWEHLQSHDFHGNYCYTDLRSHVWKFFSNQTLSFHWHNTWSTWNQQNLHHLPLRCRWNLGYRMTGVENVTRRESDGVFFFGNKIRDKTRMNLT